MFENLPDKITLIEVGPRDGFQFEKKIIPTDMKIEIISGLAEAGLRRIQVVSFVHPKIVPQMADAEEVLARLHKKEELNHVIFSGLVLNTKGAERAHLAGLRHIEVSISASDTHSRKNAGMSLEQAIDQGKEMISLAQTYHMRIRAGIQCAFGCVYEGKIPEERILQMAQVLISSGIDTLSIADTTGMANPLSITKLMEKLLPRTNGIPVVLHLHDTRGLGLANVMTGMMCGITHFDTALAGMGGCPFVTGAAGNIATEDTAYLMKSMNIETGIDLSKVANCSMQLEKFFKKQFPGKICRLPSED
ncbi:hydroxymethylglutaryl-CoA lyase [Desulfonema magnum]|uniref:Pyruvate carboxyltransferase family protein n=1 Tax=Desulfonema magnum TaxID=45655 RepID=A0A975BUJ5_9BACT|nr:hydroxymethylglutaryl-CoA lyase [Desulfonema magnum]QTA92090.1 Pyruvate carboxyltransferase family protein [Desulfonema magnum]